MTRNEYYFLNYLKKLSEDKLAFTRENIELYMKDNDSCMKSIYNRVNSLEKKGKIKRVNNIIKIL